MRNFAVLFVLLATFFLYAKTISYRFVYDDNFQILNNEHLRSWHYLPVYFTQNLWSHIPHNQTNFYRPFFLIWLRLNMVGWGEDPWGWHLMTVLVNVLVAGLTYLFAYKLLNQRLTALVAVAVFSLHPVHVEAVAWISAVNEPLGAAFLLLAFLCYLKQRDCSSIRSVWLALSVLLFTAALLTKETGIVFPFLIALYECTVGRSSQAAGGSWVKRLVPYTLVIAAYFTLRTIAMHGTLNRGEASLHDSLLSLPWLVCVYVKMLFWPGRLSPMYDLPYINHAAPIRFLISSVAILVSCALIWWIWKRGSYLVSFLVGWFAVTLAPALGAFCLAYKSESYHDRYLYLPSLAFAIFAGLGFQRFHRQPGRLRRAFLYAGTTLVLTAMAFVTYREQQNWQSNYILFRHATQVAPQNEGAAANYAEELINNGEYLAALTLSEAIIRLQPDSTLPYRQAATAAFLLHDFARAERYYMRTIELDPSVGQMHFLLGVTRMRLGQYAAAVEALRTSFLLSPEIPRFHYTLGLALAKQGEWQQARDEFAAELASQNQDPLSAQALTDAEAHLHPAGPRTEYLRQ